MKLLKILFNASVYYVIFRFLVWLTLLFNRSLSESINYHYSDSLIWYFLWFALPILASVLIAVKLQSRFFQKTGIALLPLLIVGTIIGAYFNNEYWGYPFRRPTVFKELKEASSIISITNIKKTTDEKDFRAYTDTTLTESLYGGEDLYYGNLDRPIMTFLDRANINGDLYGWYAIAKNVDKKISKSDLSLMSSLIAKSNLLVSPNEGYESSGNRFNGRIIEFKTVDGKSFYHITLKSGEVANDHYPLYEILFSKSDSKFDIVKSQYFYTDFAGVEGFEYSNLASLIEFIALVCIGLIVSLINGVEILIKRKKAITIAKKS